MIDVDRTSPEQSADYYMNAAEDAWAAGRLDQAATLARQALAATPDDANAWHMLGLIAFTQSNIDESVGNLSRACQQSTAPALYSRSLCEVLRASGRLADAELAGRQAVEREPGLALAWNSLAAAYHDDGKLTESRDAYREARRLDPTSTSTLNNLAITLYKLGDLEAAKDCLATAIAVDNANADAYGNMALVLGGLGDYDAALHHARSAVTLNPRLISAYLNAAAIAAVLGRYDVLLNWSERAVRVAPENLQVLLMYANALRRLERYDESLTVCRAAIARQPSNADAHGTLGLVLQDVGRAEEALAAFDKAITLTDAPAKIINDRAMLLMELGRKKEASAGFDDALQRDGSLAMAWYNRADLKTFADGDADIDRMETLLESQPPPGFNDQVRLHFALGKAHLDIDGASAGGSSPGQGEAERQLRAPARQCLPDQAGLAFNHFANGNRMKRSTLRYDVADDERLMQSMAETFSQSVIERLSRKGHLADAPIFVVGMPRSGTTLVEQILASHPQVAGAGELLHIQKLFRAAGLGSSPDSGLGDLAHLGRQYMALLKSSAPPAERLVDKMPSNFLYGGFIHSTLPNARIIHCRRNAADTCLSCYTKLFSGQQDFAYDLVELGRYYRGYVGLTGHWRTVLPAHAFLDVDYELLVDGLEDNVRRLLEFCGLPWDAACLRYYETRRMVKTASMTQVRSPLYKTSIGRWQRYAHHLAPLLNELAASGGLV